MHISRLTLNHFRCFAQESTLNFEHPIILISGANGTGKTALAEAFYFGCYARSFRTYSPRELINFDHDHARIDFVFTDEDGSHELHMGMSAQKKIIKLDDRALSRARQLLRIFPVIVISELDMQIITGGPAIRRSFIDQFLLLYKPDYIDLLHRLQTIVANRTALLQKQETIDQDLFKQWTKALWEQSLVIQVQRIQALERIMAKVILEVQGVLDCGIQAHYASRILLGDSFDDFWMQHINLFAQEKRQRRTLFGAQLDDILFTFNDKPARFFASRGQQKIIITMLKSSLVRILGDFNVFPVLFFDDIMMDFDTPHLAKIVEILQNLDCQLFISCAQQQHVLLSLLKSNCVQQIQLV